MGALPQKTIKYVGIFDYEKLFQKMYDWLIHNSYIVYETKHKHKISSPKGANDEIGWRAERKVDVYFKETIWVEIFTWDIREVEIIEEDHFIKKNYGKVKIKINSALDADYSKRMAKIPVIQKFLEKIVLKNDLGDVQQDRLHYRIYKFHAMIKEYFDMETKFNQFEWRW